MITGNTLDAKNYVRIRMPNGEGAPYITLQMGTGIDFKKGHKSWIIDGSGWRYLRCLGPWCCSCSNVLVICSMPRIQYFRKGGLGVGFWKKWGGGLGRGALTLRSPQVRALFTFFADELGGRGKPPGSAPLS